MRLAKAMLTHTFVDLEGAELVRIRWWCIPRERIAEELDAETTNPDTDSDDSSSDFYRNFDSLPQRPGFESF